MDISLNQRKLRLVSGIETRTLRDGTFLLKHPWRGSYLAVNTDQKTILDQFAGTVAVGDILRGLLETEHHDIRSFYDLVIGALDKGMLTDAPEVSEANGTVIPRDRIFNPPFGWGIGVPLITVLIFAPVWLWMILTARPLLPGELIGWLRVLLWLIGFFSIAIVGAACVLRGFDCSVYGAGIAFRYGIPVFSIDARDAFMGGRSCQAAVALQRLAAPLVFGCLVFLFGRQSDGADFAAGVWEEGGLASVLAVLAMLTPFGDSPGHNLLHALFRKSYELPRCAETFLGRRIFQSLFSSRRKLAEEEYLFAYAAFAIVWFGVLAACGAYIVRQQGYAFLETAFLAPDLSTRLLAIVVIVGLIVFLLGPFSCQLWLLVRNTYALVAPHWFKAETNLRKKGLTNALGPGQIAQFLSGTLLFKQLNVELTAEIAGHMNVVTADAGRSIIREGDIGETLFVVYEGTVRVFKENDAGVDREVAQLGSGDVFGEIALLENVPRTASVKAETDTVLLALDRESFNALLVDAVGADEVAQLIQICAHLKRHRLFSAWPDSVLQEFARSFSFREVKAGEVLVSTDSANRTFFLIYEGSVDVMQNSSVMAHLGAGEFFGEISLLKEQLPVADVVAAEDGRCLVLDKDEFYGVLSRDVYTGLAVEDTAEKRKAAIGK